MRWSSRRLAALVTAVVVLSAAGCAAFQTSSHTRRDKTKKGAAIGAASGAAAAILLGEREADEILAGAAIGAAIGAGVGAYMDQQEDRIARIPGTTVERVSADTLLVHFDSDVLFAVDSAILNEGSRGALEQATSVFLDFPKTAVVAQGHTDSTGSESHNQALSERRAEAVRGYLVARGVDPERIVALGYGEAYPVADNSTTEGRARNRRVDLLLKGKAK